ncbi:MAG: DUF2062 domain-containing protein [Opitutae bacterium]|nr:DUF2062 domain-containing protein [Opitutae bacterium]
MFKKLKLVVVAQLRQGLGQQACCHAIAASLTIGLFPIMGFSTFVNAFIAAYFRLNQPVVQVCNWIIAPVKVALIFPFLRLGEWLFQAKPFRLSLAEFSTRFFSEIATTTVEFAWTFAHAIAGWLICAPLIYGVIFRVSKALVRHRLASSPSRVIE